MPRRAGIAHTSIVDAPLGLAAARADRRCACNLHTPPGVLLPHRREGASARADDARGLALPDRAPLPSSTSRRSPSLEACGVGILLGTLSKYAPYLTNVARSVSQAVAQHTTTYPPLLNITDFQYRIPCILQLQRSQELVAASAPGSGPTGRSTARPGSAPRSLDEAPGKRRTWEIGAQARHGL
jgi:hypothetical protein